jgi:hypothetical protein
MSQLALGLGTIHPNCRVSHYGFQNNNATTGWLNTAWTDYSETNPRLWDEGINLNFLFPLLDPGAAVSFTWVYVLRMSDLLPAMEALNSVVIVQPATSVSGVAATFSCAVSGNANPVVFSIVDQDGKAVVVGSLRQPTMPDGTGGGLYIITVDVGAYPTGDGYLFKVDATVNGRVYSADKVVRIVNDGPQVSCRVARAYACVRTPCCCCSCCR